MVSSHTKMILMNEYNSAVSLCVFGLGFTVWFSVWYPGWGFLLTLGFVYRVGLRVLGVCFSDLVEFVIRVSFWFGFTTRRPFECAAELSVSCVSRTHMILISDVISVVSLWVVYFTHLGFFCNTKRGK